MSEVESTFYGADAAREKILRKRFAAPESTPDGGLEMRSGCAFKPLPRKDFPGEFVYRRSWDWPSHARAMYGTQRALK